jgi:predicted O-methyltransferase YrrM
MTTPDTAALTALLHQLFIDADATSALFRQQLDALPATQRRSMMASKDDYVAFYSRAKDAHLAVSRETGTLLYMLARAINARTINEFGTSFGVSTLHLAAALRDNGGGKLVTSEFEPTKIPRARANITAGGLADLVEIREGDALQTLAQDLPESIDLLLLDGAKGLYSDILSLVEERLRVGALIIADNAEWSPDYLARVRSPDQGYMSVPFAEDIELSMRVSASQKGTLQDVRTDDPPRGER